MLRTHIHFILKAIFVFLPLLLLAQTDIQIPDDAAFVIEKNQAVNSLFIHSDIKKGSPYFELEKTGEDALKDKNWCLATDIYKKLVNLDDKNADYHYKYGAALGFKILDGNKFKALFLMGKVKSEFLKASKLDKQHIDARWALIETYLRLPFFLGGSNSKAKSYANQLERISEIDGLLAKGRIAKYTKKYNSAEVYFKHAVEVGGSKNSYYRLIELYDVFLKEPQKALDVLQVAIKKYPSDLRYYYQYGKISIENHLNQKLGESYLNYFITHHTQSSPIALEEAYRLLKP